MRINDSIFLMSAMILLPGLLTAEVSRSETDFGYVNKFTVDEVDYQANVYTRTGTAWSLSILLSFARTRLSSLVRYGIRSEMLIFLQSISIG